MNDDFSKFEKEDLYKSAFTDLITGNYNWNHLEAYLEVPADKGINDYAFAHFDVKEFRIINEVYGHIAANNVLCKIVNGSYYIFGVSIINNQLVISHINDYSSKQYANNYYKNFINNWTNWTRKNNLC